MKKIGFILILILLTTYLPAQTVLECIAPQSQELEDDIIVKNSSPYAINNITIFSGNKQIAQGKDIAGGTKLRVSRFSDYDISTLRGKTLRTEILSADVLENTAEFTVECRESDENLIIEIMSVKNWDYQIEHILTNKKADDKVFVNNLSPYDIQTIAVYQNEDFIMAGGAIQAGKEREIGEFEDKELKTLLGKQLLINVESQAAIEANAMLYATSVEKNHDLYITVSTENNGGMVYVSPRTPSNGSDNTEYAIELLRTNGGRAFDAGNYAFAAVCFSKAAAKSHNSADEFNAGLSYDYAADYHKAHFWYENAAKRGNTEAQKELPRALYNRGWKYEQTRNYQQALDYYQQAYNAGYTDGLTAYNNLKTKMETPSQTSTTTSSSTTTSNSNLFLDILDATAKTMGLISDIKNDGTKSPSSSTSNSSSSDISSSSNSSSNDNSSSKPEKKVPSNAFCTEKARLYFQYEKRLLQMKRDPEIHYNNTDRRNIQKDMRRLRNDLISSGCNQNPYKSAMEDWDGTLD